MRYSVIFPGQGSQSVGMLSDWLDSNAPPLEKGGRGDFIVQKTFEEASEVLGYDLRQLVLEGPKERLDETEYTQPALLAAGVAAWRVLKHAVPTLSPVYLAGHSLGEYTALVCANSISFATGLACVQKRGQLMQSAVQPGVGAMAAVLGLDDTQQIQAICLDVAQGEVLSPVNYNAIGQTVIAGHKGAVERAMVALKEAGAKRVLLLPVSVPSHCALMRGIADEFYDFLKTFEWQSPEIPVIHNVDVAMHTDVKEILECLKQQLYSPVRWVETIQHIAEKDSSLFLECGPGKVLSGLSKRIMPGITTLPVLDNETLTAAVTMIEGLDRE